MNIIKAVIERVVFVLTIALLLAFLLALGGCATVAQQRAEICISGNCPSVAVPRQQPYVSPEMRLAIAAGERDRQREATARGALHLYCKTYYGQGQCAYEQCVYDGWRKSAYSRRPSSSFYPWSARRDIFRPAGCN
jgi:hypothetical protein